MPALHHFHNMTPAKQKKGGSPGNDETSELTISEVSALLTKAPLVRICAQLIGLEKVLCLFKISKRGLLLVKMI